MFGEIGSGFSRIPFESQRHRGRLPGNTNVLGLGEEAERFFAAFAADTAGFHAAEWDAEIAHQPTVHPNRAGVDLFGDAMGAAEVLRPNTR